MSRTAFRTQSPSLNARAVGRVLSAGTTLARAASAAVEGVDLMVRDLRKAGSGPREVRARMAGLGLRGGAWPMPVTRRADSAQVAHDRERLPRLAEHGGRLGLKVIGVARFRTGRGGLFGTRRADLDRGLGRLRDEEPNLGILLDGFHRDAAGETIEVGLAWRVDRVVWVHRADLSTTALPDRAAIRDGKWDLPGDTGAIDGRSFGDRLAGEGRQRSSYGQALEGMLHAGGTDRRKRRAQDRHGLRAVWPVGLRPCRLGSGAI